MTNQTPTPEQMAEQIEDAINRYKKIIREETARQILNEIKDSKECIFCTNRCKFYNNDLDLQDGKGCLLRHKFKKWLGAEK